MHGPDGEDDATTEAVGEVCSCPCKHAAPIMVRVGFMLCVVGKEKLCADCVRPVGSAFKCHMEHTG